MIYFWIIAVSVSVYVSIILFIYFFQAKLIFRPIPLAHDYKFSFEYPFEELWLGKFKKINALIFRVKNPKGVVLYHHGNSRNIQHWGDFHTDFTSRGYDVLFYDYNGFGKSGGILTEQSLYRDAKICYQYLQNHYPKEKIYQYGRSLGSALATRLALRFGSPFLVLETPYLSMKKMAQNSYPFLPISWMIRFPLRQDLDIKAVKCPILIISGSQDELTPHNHSQLLSEMNPKAKLVVIKDGQHNGLNQYDLYQKVFDDYYGAKISVLA
jgi:uncharacterized protein